MITCFEKRHKSLSYRILSAFIAFTFIFSLVLPPGYAQLVPQALNLPAPGAMVPLTNGFIPPIIKGVTIDPTNPFEFNFIIGTGDEHLQGEAFRQESRKMIKYFLAALTVPEKELWVNLSPYEKNRMIPQAFGETEMGKDLLAQDYILKQLTASLMYPEEELGKKFWDKVYSQAKEKYGTTEIPMNTFNKVWIVPEKAVVYQHEISVPTSPDDASGESGLRPPMSHRSVGAFVVKSHLKVMLEQDYAAMHQNLAETPASLFPEGKQQGLEARSDVVTTGIIREVILPAIEKEVNEGKTFANLRQIYNSVILAAWYKQNLRQTLLGQIYVDQGKTAGVGLQDKTVNEKIYNQYLEAFKKGVYNYIKEDVDPATQEVIPRKYFSGGANLALTGEGDGTNVAASPILETVQNREIAKNILSDPKDLSVQIALLKVPEDKGIESVQKTAEEFEIQSELAKARLADEKRLLAQANEIANAQFDRRAVATVSSPVGEEQKKAELEKAIEFLNSIYLSGNRFVEAEPGASQSKKLAIYSLKVVFANEYDFNSVDAKDKTQSLVYGKKTTISYNDQSPREFELSNPTQEEKDAAWYKLKRDDSVITILDTAPVTADELLEFASARMLNKADIIKQYRRDLVLTRAEEAQREYVIGGNLAMAVRTEKDVVDLFERTVISIVRSLPKGADPAKLDIVITVAPSFVHLSAVRTKLKELVAEGKIPEGFVYLGAQDVSLFGPGAQTGEISIEQLIDLNVKYVILGHPERRHGLMAESSKLIAEKARRVLKKGLIPIIAVGETLKEWENNETEEILKGQIEESLSGIDMSQNADNIIIVYAPVWEIETGMTVTPDEANATQRFIRSILLENYGEAVASKVRIQYGGSMRPDNVEGLINQPNIDGGLIGRAAWNAQQFAQIVIGSLNHSLSRQPASSPLDSVNIPGAASLSAVKQTESSSPVEESLQEGLRLLNEIRDLEEQYSVVVGRMDVVRWKNDQIAFKYRRAREAFEEAIRLGERHNVTAFWIVANQFAGDQTISELLEEGNQHMEGARYFRDNLWKYQTPSVVQQMWDTIESREVKALELFEEVVEKKKPELLGSSPVRQNIKDVGGIDLNPLLMDLQVKRDGNGVPLPLPMQPIENMRIDGFLPVIINVTPVTNLPMLLGIADSDLPANSADSDSQPMELGLAVKEN